MSRIRTNLITNRMANGAPTVSNGLVISGVTTSTTFSGSGASLTNLPAAQLTGALPALDGSNLTGITQTTINNNANNRIITGSGTANTLEGESTITYDNPTLEINTDTSPYGTLTLNGTTGGLVQFEDNEVTKWSIFGDHALNFYNNANSASRLYINSSGQMGLGVEPNTNWPSNNDYKALQLGTGACVFGRGSGDEDRGGIAVNWYSDGSNNKYLGNGNAARIYLADGNIYFSTAGANSSGANASMTLNDRMILNSSGKLGIGFNFNYTMNSDSTNLVIGDGGGAKGITIWTAAGADSQNISFQTNESLSRAEGEISYGPTATSTTANRNAMMFRVNSAERMRIDSNGYVTMPNQPAFRAYISGGPQSINGTIPFSQNDYNIGSNYNTSNYRFTAPVAGRYQFNFYSIYRGNHTNNYFGFLKNGASFNGDRAHFTHPNLGSAWDYIDMSQVLNLAAGDYVTCVTHNAVDLHGGNWAAFSGHLVG